MNREQIFVGFAKYVLHNKVYMEQEDYGIIEDVLAWFNLPTDRFHINSVTHRKHLDRLHDFIVHTATDEQCKMLYRVSQGADLPKMSPVVGCSGMVFVSMPMNKDKCQYVEEIRKGIDDGLALTGNRAYFLDKNAHGENIYIKMLDEICASRFVVADLTSQNTGVYFEAGYAKAIGKSTILTCHKEDFVNVHFDLKQTQILIWSSCEDLIEKLKNQVIGLGLDIKTGDT